MKKYPRVGIGVLILDGNNLLLAKRRGSHGAGMWQSGGGHLEFGEEFEACVKREIAEEVGITVSNIALHTVTNNFFPKEDKHYVTIFMTCHYTSGNPQVLEPDKCSEWKWFPLDKMPENLFFPYDKILKNKTF